MAKYASGEKPIIGDVVRCVRPDGSVMLIKFGEVITVTEIDAFCVGSEDGEEVKWFIVNRFELVRRADAKMEEAKQELDNAIEDHIEREEFVPQLGWWRQRDGGLALTDYRDEESELISGVANYNNDKPYMESWELDGKRQSDEKSQVDLIEFLAPFEIPNVIEPDIIDWTGTYELEDTEQCLVIASSGDDWLVYIPSEGDTLHRYYSNGVHICGAMYRIVKKISDVIEL